MSTRACWCCVGGLSGAPESLAAEEGSDSRGNKPAKSDSCAPAAAAAAAAAAAGPDKGGCACCWIEACACPNCLGLRFSLSHFSSFLSCCRSSFLDMGGTAAARLSEGPAAGAGGAGGCEELANSDGGAASGSAAIGSASAATATASSPPAATDKGSTAEAATWGPRPDGSDSGGGGGGAAAAACASTDKNVGSAAAARELQGPPADAGVGAEHAFLAGPRRSCPSRGSAAVGSGIAAAGPTAADVGPCWSNALAHAVAVSAIDGPFPCTRCNWLTTSSDGALYASSFMAKVLTN
eukprot:1158362-Pelagomonas_calceolata.AAC.1